MFKEIKKHWPILILLFIIPVILAFLITTSWFDGIAGSNDGWLGFWGGYLGAIIAIGGVYWQVKEEFNHNEQIKLNSTLPFFYIRHKEKIVSLSKRYFLPLATGDDPDYGINFSKKINEYITHLNQGNSFRTSSGYVLSISNISPNEIYLVKVKLTYTNGKSNFYYILNMPEDSEIKVLGLDIFNEKFKLKEGTIYFTSTQSRKYKYYFKVGENFKRESIQMIDDYSFEYDQSDSIMIKENKEE